MISTPQQKKARQLFVELIVYCMPVNIGTILLAGVLAHRVMSGKGANRKSGLLYNSGTPHTNSSREQGVDVNLLPRT
jgi:hypothetical protein